MSHKGAAKDKNLMAGDGTEKPRVSLAEAAAKIDALDLENYLDVPSVPDIDVLRFYFYFEEEFAQVSWTWVKMFNESPLSTLIDVPLSQIPTPIYELSVDWIKPRPVEFHSYIILWICDRILDNLVSEGGDNAPPSVWPKSQAAHFVVLAMVLRTRPDSLIDVLPSLRDKHMYQGPDKLPLIVWMMAQASRGDLSTGLYSWMCNLLPLLVSNNKSCSPQSTDLVLQFAEYMLSRPKALTILVNGGGVMERQQLVPLPSLDILLRLTFPLPSARVKTTKRFKAIYPSLKEVALSPERARGDKFAMRKLFTFALTLTGEKGNFSSNTSLESFCLFKCVNRFVTGNPSVLTKEATSIAIRSLTENINCFDHWDRLYMNNPEASVALLKKLIDDNHFLRLSTSPIDTLTVNQIMESFRRKNKRAIAEGGANCSLYKEADKYCKLISRRLSRGNRGFKMTLITAVNPKAKKLGTMDGDGAAKQIVSLAEAAAKIDPHHLRDHLVNALRECWRPEELLSRYTDYFEKALSGVSFPWVKMFKDAPLSTLIDVPLSHVPDSVYETTRNWISLPPAGMFVALAIVLRSKPEALTSVLPTLRKDPKYHQGHDKLPITVWMMAQASKGDTCVGLYSWAHNLLPLVTLSNEKRCCIPHSLDLILQFVEEIVSRPKARTILVDGALTLREGEPLIPLSSFEILLRLAFPAPSTRVESTERVEAIYPLLKDVALSEDIAGSNAVEQMFTFALRSARQGIVTGNLALAEEATSIAIWCMFESVDCVEHWNILYRENLEASVARLKKLVEEFDQEKRKLVGEQKVHFLRLPSVTLIFNQAMEKFRRKNKKAIAERGAICSLYKEADKYCTRISWRLSCGNRGFKMTPITAVVLFAAGAAAAATLIALSQ
ncbi:unnamed protein product [Eruca vesicaria subsp. sativa]|uniref:Transmembrane protein n=1 Tax=Eruca vesicaria subsp. sativa TaxID=29727 RepID=A0ABC8KTN1_ERUVS|nr:unnamed protein product [Eruca vesicaria subsp. sativa]